MANWGILNKKFDEVMANMTPEKWKDWMENKSSKKMERDDKMCQRLGVLYGESARIFLEKMEENNKNIGKETAENFEFDREIWERVIEKSKKKITNEKE